MESKQSTETDNNKVSEITGDILKKIKMEPKKDYAQKSYWDERYEFKKGETFEWLENWRELQPLFKLLKIPGFFNPNGESPPDDMDFS